MSSNSPLLEEMTTKNILNQELKMHEHSLTLHDEDKCQQYPFLVHKKEKKIYSKSRERIKKPLEPGKLVGHWNTLEKKKYHWFLEMHHEHFENKHMRRMDKIFKSMSDFIQTRAADQCRSHHQKMQKKFKTFHKIILNLRISNYNSTDVSDMKAEIQAFGLQTPSSLIDAKIFEDVDSFAENKEEKESFQSHEMKEQNCIFDINQQDNFLKDLQYIEQPIHIHEPLI